MPWVVDTCLVLDVFYDDPQFGMASAVLLDTYRPLGLVICPVSLVEFAPATHGNEETAVFFLSQIGIALESAWEHQDTRHAFHAWQRHVQLKRLRRMARRPMADILIGAFAERHEGLLTRNPSDFKAVFPHLAVVAPS